jgi:hypothetical protein
VWAEAQAKIADVAWPTLPNRVDPYHLTTARRELLDEGVIEEVAARTRGRRIESVLALTDRASRPGGLRAFEDAAARKRLLAARYHSWAVRRQGIRTYSGLQASAALSAAAPGRYTLLPASHSGEIEQLFGRPVPGGPLDSAAYLNLTDSQGRPTAHPVPAGP